MRSKKTIKGIHFMIDEIMKARIAGRSLYEFT